MEELFVSESTASALNNNILPIDFGLDYINEIVREHLTTDHLCVLAKGLGLHRVAAAIIYCVDAAGTHRYGPNNPPYAAENLVIIVNAQRRDIRLIKQQLEIYKERQGNQEVRRGIQEINSSVPVSKRQSMYESGGIYTVTSRILTVDMITETVNPKKITGLIILNSQFVGENSKEAFIVRLLRQHNKEAFTKALSDEPSGISRGINGLSHRLRNLAVDQVSLWPRFRVEVKDRLGRSELNEVILEMDERTLEIQHYLHDIIQKCISQIKANVKNIDTEMWTVDAAFEGNLRRSIRIAVDPVYHKLNFEAKQAIADLDNLQHLLHSLCNAPPAEWDCDAQVILMASSNEKHPSLWLDSASADAMFKVAKDRIDHSDVPGKWNVLLDILSEVGSRKRVLIMCSNNRTVKSLRSFLALKDSYNTQLQIKAKEQLKDYKRTIKGLKSKDDVESNSITPEPGTTSKPSSTGPKPPPSKRRRVRGGAASAPERSSGESMLEDSNEHAFPTLRENQGVWLHCGSGPLFYEDRAVPEVKFVEGEPDFSELPPPNTSDPTSGEIVLCCYDVPEILSKFHPDVVIMYEPDVQFTREIEVHQALHGPLNEVHFMYYQRSVEEMTYLAELRKEKDTFSSLIREKAGMAMVINDEFHRKGPGELRVVNTRLAGGQTRVDVFNEPEKIIVDAREFMSDLPFLIWRQSIDIIPMQLEVGDYILTPEIVVERKSIPDLMSSFNDGRLFEQCTKMFRHYKTPVLLIEFSDDKAFSFDQFRDVQKKENIVYERLCITMVMFPKLKIVWSSSQRNTAEIFESLKRDQKQPDPLKCAQVGRKLIINTTALDMLRSMPGLDSTSAELVAERLNCLADLADMPFEQLITLIGRENATRLHNFLDKKL